MPHKIDNPYTALTKIQTKIKTIAILLCDSIQCTSCNDPNLYSITNCNHIKWILLIVFNRNINVLKSKILARLSLSTTSFETVCLLASKCKIIFEYDCFEACFW